MGAVHMAKGESACQPWSWLQREDMGRSTQPRKSLTGHHCSASGTWALKADPDWEGLFTQGGLLQQGHRNQPTIFVGLTCPWTSNWNVVPEQLFLWETHLETQQKTNPVLFQSNTPHTGTYPGSTQIISQINCHHPYMKEGKWRFTAEHNHREGRAGQQLQEGTPSRLCEFMFKNTEKVCRGMFYKVELVISGRERESFCEHV